MLTFILTLSVNCFCGCTEKISIQTLSLWLLPSPSPKYMIFFVIIRWILWYLISNCHFLQPVWKLIIIKTVRYFYLDKLCFISIKSLYMLMFWLFIVNLTKLELFKKRNPQLRKCFHKICLLVRLPCIFWNTDR